MKINKKRYLSQKTREQLTGLVYIIPWIIGFGLFVLYPLIRTIYFSFNTVKYSAELGYLFEWIGWDNYQRILTVDVDFILEAQDFVVRILTYVPVIIVLSIVVAVLLNSKLKGTRFFRVIFFLPVIILNGQLLDNLTNNGGMTLEVGGFIFNVISKVVPGSMIGPILTLFFTIYEILWYCGVPILIFLAALQKIDPSIYEASQIDGASAWDVFWKITLPALYPLISVSIVFIIVYLGNFDGNPINDLILTSSSNPARREGYASALAILYSLVQTFLIITLYMLFKNREGRKAT